MWTTCKKHFFIWSLSFLFPEFIPHNVLNRQFKDEELNRLSKHLNFKDTTDLTSFFMELGLDSNAVAQNLNQEKQSVNDAKSLCFQDWNQTKGLEAKVKCVVNAWKNVYGEETDEIFIEKILTMWIMHEKIYIERKQMKCL